MTITANRRAIIAATLGGAAASALPDAVAAVRTPSPNPIVGSRQPALEISSGRIRGFEQAGVRAFWGIPYGAPTDGANRFQPPRPPAPWSGVRDAICYGPICPWFPSPMKDVGAPENPEGGFLLYRNWMPQTASEDCLRLNVWAPPGSGKRPVMVYMHGGGFVAGSGHGLPAYDGANLARRGDVVVVTHNHRLNMFGYMDLSSFGGRWSQSVNLGLQDLVAVLQWVRENIAAFGGDPGNVTIFGQSGGGGKVLALMAMPSAKGLFHKAIVQSGTFPNSNSMPAAEAKETAQRVVTLLGLDGASLDKLRDVKVEELCAIARNIITQAKWKPVVDGSILPSAPGAPGALSSGVPLLIGTNLNEAVNALDNPLAANFDDAALTAAASKQYGAAGSAIVDAYRKSLPGRTAFECFGAMGAAGIREESFRVADRKYALNGQVWQYLFAWATPMLEGRPKTFHSAEIAFVFNNAGLCRNQTGGGPAALALAGRMSDAWIAFARTGNPNHVGLPHWPACAADHPTMVFDNRCEVRPDPDGPGRKLLPPI